MNVIRRYPNFCIVLLTIITLVVFGLTCNKVIHHWFLKIQQEHIRIQKEIEDEIINIQYQQALHVNLFRQEMDELVKKINRNTHECQSNFNYDIYGVDEKQYNSVRPRSDVQKESPFDFKPRVIDFSDVISLAEDHLSQKKSHSNDHIVNDLIITIGSNRYRYSFLKNIINRHYDLIIAIPSSSKTNQRDQGQHNHYQQSEYDQEPNHNGFDKRKHASFKDGNHLRFGLNTLRYNLSKKKDNFKNMNILVYVHNEEYRSSVNDKDSNLENKFFDDIRVQMGLENSEGIFLYDNPMPFLDPFLDVSTVDAPSPNQSKKGERQKTCDFISMTELILRNFKFDMLMYAGEDFRWCEDSLHHIFLGLDAIKNRIQKPMCSLRVSYGLSGIIMPKEQVQHFVHYTQQNIDKSSIDELLQDFQFMNKQLWNFNNLCSLMNLPTFTYSKVLLERIPMSQHQDDPKQKFPACGESMSHSPGLSEKERFDEECESIGVSPCSP